ncbi:hypothetical protein IAT40_005295 [Kwoniella sp. CBS 6097]
MNSVKGKSKAFTQNKERIASYMNCGRRALAEKDWAGARDNFDKAISFGGQDIVLLDLKVQALTELEGWQRTACEITESMIKRWPDDYRGYERKARIQAKLHYFAHAVQSITTAINVLRAQFQSQNQPQPRSSSSASSLSASSSSTSNARARSQQILERLNKYRSDLLYAQDEAEKRVSRRSAEDKARIEADKIQAKRSMMNFINRLSADVIITIAEHGLVEHPGFAVKMAAVCKSWRNILLNQGSLWNKLVLGKKKPVERIKWCLERTRGNIKELKIASDFEHVWTYEVAALLEPSLKSITHLTIMFSDGQLLDLWAGKFDRLRCLKIVIPDKEALVMPDRTRLGFWRAPDLVSGLLGPEAASLRELDLQGFTITHFNPVFAEPAIETFHSDTTEQIAVRAGADADSQGSAPERPVWTSNATVHLGSLKKIRLSKCTIRCAWPDHSELLRYLEQIESFTMEDTRWDDTSVTQDDGTSRWMTQRQAERTEIDLPHLKTYCISGTARNLALNGIHAPHLEHLDLYRANLRGSSIVPHILSPGLEHALPNLLSLDIGRCAITLMDMKDILPKLPQLKFLNVSFCSLNNTFLEALERKNTDKDLVPNLMALSIAGNTEITSGPLRRFVMSRTKEGIKETSSSSSSASGKGPAKRSGPFGPTLVRNSSPFAPSRPSSAPASQRQTKSTITSGTSGPATLGSSSSAKPSSSTMALKNQNASQAQASSQKPAGESEKAVLPSIQWLNIDQCERIEPEAIDILRKQGKVRFVSQIFGNTIEDNRIRGKGRWKWDAGFEEGCSEEGCSLRKVPGSKDGYFVHHTCRKEIPKDSQDEDESEKGWAWVPSQSASQSQSQTQQAGSWNAGSFQGF